MIEKELVYEGLEEKFDAKALLDPDIGITVALTTGGDPLFCLRSRNQLSEEQWNAVYQYASDRIYKGVLNAKELMEFVNELTGSLVQVDVPTAESCAFMNPQRRKTNDRKRSSI